MGTQEPCQLHLTEAGDCPGETEGWLRFLPVLHPGKNMLGKCWDVSDIYISYHICQMLCLSTINSNPLIITLPCPFHGQQPFPWGSCSRVVSNAVLQVEGIHHLALRMLGGGSWCQAIGHTNCRNSDICHQSMSNSWSKSGVLHHLNRTILHHITFRLCELMWSVMCEDVWCFMWQDLPVGLLECWDGRRRFPWRPRMLCWRQSPGATKRLRLHYHLDPFGWFIHIHSSCVGLNSLVFFWSNPKFI